MYVYSLRWRRQACDPGRGATCGSRAYWRRMRAWILPWECPHEQIHGEAMADDRWQNGGDTYSSENIRGHWEKRDGRGQKMAYLGQSCFFFFLPFSNPSPQTTFELTEIRGRMLLQVAQVGKSFPSAPRGVSGFCGNLRGSGTVGAKGRVRRTRGSTCSFLTGTRS